MSHQKNRGTSRGGTSEYRATGTVPGPVHFVWGGGLVHSRPRVTYIQYVLLLHAGKMLTGGTCRSFAIAVRVR